VDVPDEGLLCDLLWADPDMNVSGWARNPRGVSYLFGYDVLEEFLAKHDLDLVCRAHQVRTATRGSGGMVHGQARRAGADGAGVGVARWWRMGTSSRRTGSW
jgi:hypothetical protein